jgi:hypothetical protein
MAVATIQRELKKMRERDSIDSVPDFVLHTREFDEEVRMEFSISLNRRRRHRARTRRL